MWIACFVVYYIVDFENIKLKAYFNMINMDQQTRDSFTNHKLPDYFDISKMSRIYIDQLDCCVQD
jgi:hypothetical protein